MSNHKKNISLVIEDNLSTLYAFALGMISEQKHAEGLMQMLIVKAINHKDELTEHDDIKAYLFKLLYHLCIENLDQKLDHYDKNSENKLEEFYLYNRLEEIQIRDDDKLKMVSGLNQNELEEIIANLPIKFRPIMLLRDFYNFSYPQISYILNIPLDIITHKLSVVNKIFQSELWKNLVNKRHHVSQDG